MNALVPVLPLPPAGLLNGASLFIDFDGTLVELAERPDRVTVDDALRDLLGRLGCAFPGRVALVSGRSIAQLDQMLGPLTSNLAVAGSHGAERRWSDGIIEHPARGTELDAAAAALTEFAFAHPGTVVEPKSYGVALHYRLAPADEARARRVAAELAKQHGLAVQHGKMMVELKVAGGDKGSAVRAFSAQREMAGAPPIFIGDDLTDEAGFEAAQALGGAGVFVGSPGFTVARYGLPDVAATRAWLASAIEPQA